MTSEKTSKQKIEELIVHLRSGKFDQCKSRLHLENSNSFCCLGVMAHAVEGIDRNLIATPSYKTEHPKDNGMIKDSYSAVKDTFREVFASSSTEFDTCIEMNDGGKSFDDIADYLEVKLKNVK